MRIQNEVFFETDSLAYAYRKEKYAFAGGEAIILFERGVGMEREVTSIIQHIADSQARLADILAAKRPVVEHAVIMLSGLPAAPGDDVAEQSAYSGAMMKSLASYLNGFAELEDALAENLSLVIKELAEQEE